MTGFGGFIALDWSGARQASGIAIAECAPGDAAPRLVPPAGGRWTRAAALDWLVRRVDRGDRPLIGIDCAFSLPFARAAGYFASADAGAFDLWDLVDRVAAAAGVADLSGAPFAVHPTYRDDFWHAGPAAADRPVARRATERACACLGLGMPETPYKLIGAKQVGKGALAGMRVLAALRRARPDGVAVWPFEPAAPDRAVVVEIYPRLFLRVSGGPRSAKLRSWAGVDACLAALGSASLADRPADPPSDHDTDALVAAAGMRRVADDLRLWDRAALAPTDRDRDGWIFGVPPGSVAAIRNSPDVTDLPPTEERSEVIGAGGR